MLGEAAGALLQVMDRAIFRSSHFYGIQISVETTFSTTFLTTFLTMLQIVFSLFPLPRQGLGQFALTWLNAWIGFRPRKHCLQVPLRHRKFVGDTCAIQIRDTRTVLEVLRWHEVLRCDPRRSSRGMRGASMHFHGLRRILMTERVLAPYMKWSRMLHVIYVSPKDTQLSTFATCCYVSSCSALRCTHHTSLQNRALKTENFLFCCKP